MYSTLRFCWSFLRRSASATIPVRQRISYKLAVITYKTNLTKTPAYLSDIIHEYHPTHTLRSADKLLLTVPRMPLTLSAKAFCVSAPSIWNSLSYNCRSADRTSQYFQATFKDRTVWHCLQWTWTLRLAPPTRASDSLATYGKNILQQEMLRLYGNTK